MKIAIDGVPAAKGQKTGVEWYVYHLLRAMNAIAPELDVTVYTHRPLDFVLEGAWKNRVLRWSLPGWKWRWSQYLRSHQPDVLFIPGDALPPKTYGRVVWTAHDVGFLHRPQDYDARTRRRLTRSYRRAVEASDRIIAITESTKNDLIQAYSVSGNNIDVVHLAHETKPIDTGTIDFALPERYVVMIGRLEAKKGALDLIEAFERLDDERLHLVFVGSPGEHGYDTIRRRIDGNDRVHAFGYLDEAAKQSVLKSAVGFAFPSHFEGFGIPILEAMAAGVPVACSDMPALREVGGAAPLYVPIGDVDAWVGALTQLTADNHQDRIDAGMRRAELFSWKKTAQQTIDVLKNV